MGMRRSGWVTAVAALAALAGCTLLVSVDDLTGGATVEGVDAGSDAPVLPAIDAGDGGDATSSDADADAEPRCPSTDPSLVAWFRFDETMGTSAADCSKSALTATSIGNQPPRWTQGHVGRAITFDGAGCLEVNAPTSLFAFEGAPFTIAAWIYVVEHATPANTGRFVAAHKTMNGWHFGTDSPLRAELDLEYPDAGKLEVSATVPTLVWRHVAGVYEPGTKATVYVGGVAQQTATMNVPPLFQAPNSTPSLRIGCRSPGNNHFRGSVDDLRIYSRALDVTEIVQLASR